MFFLPNQETNLKCLTPYISVLNLIKKLQKNKINSKCINHQQFCRITFLFLLSKSKTNTIISELSNYLARKPPWNIWQSLVSDINFRSEKQKYSIVIQLLVKYIFLWVQRLSLIDNANSSTPEENLLPDHGGIHFSNLLLGDSLRHDH